MYRKRLLASAAIILILKKKLNNNNGICITESLKEREDCNEGSISLLRELFNHKNDFVNFFRIDIQMFNYLVDKLQPHISKLNTNLKECISVTNKLAVTLRYIVTGETLTSLHYHFKIGISTISTFIPITLKYIHTVLKEEYMKVPDTEVEWRNIADGFQDVWQLPNCIGALGARYIDIQSATTNKDDSQLTNDDHSTNREFVLMALVDSKARFTYVEIACGGGSLDSGVFESCALSKLMGSPGNDLNIPAAKTLPGRSMQVPYHVTGNDAFPLKSYLMKPAPLRYATAKDKVYNCRESRGRAVIDKAFGQLVSRYEIFRKPIKLSPAKVDLIVMACVSLHNLLSNSTNEFTLDNTKLKGIPTSSKHNRSTFNAQRIRNELIEYYSNEGYVSFEDD